MLEAATQAARIGRVLVIAAVQRLRGARDPAQQLPQFALESLVMCQDFSLKKKIQNASFKEEAELSGEGAPGCWGEQAAGIVTGSTFSVSAAP